MVTLAVLSAACAGVFSRKYEYEEEVFLALDGSATVYVNASLPALVALRGAPLPVGPSARLDRDVVRQFFESEAGHVANVSASRRDNRRYVHVRIAVPDIRALGSAAPFAWSTYQFAERDGEYEYHQVMGASAGRDVGDVGWNGSERVAVRLHLPSKVPFHNSPSRAIERGNIIVWEQPLADRLEGVPLDVVARMDTQSILSRTLALFGLMIVLVAATFAAAIWWVKNKGTGAAGAA